VSLATVFGHLLRCLYYRGHQCRPTGTCKAGWIAEVFGIDLRNVKEARKALVELGLLRFERVGQKFLNRHGPLVTVNLEWAPWVPERRQLPPRLAVSRGELPPPIREHELLRIFTNQNPGGGRPAGVRAQLSGNRKPSLRHIVPADLTDGARLACLFEQACAAGHVRRTEADRLNFFAMARHACAIGRRNAPGLFAANIRARRWAVITLDDEDAGRQDLRWLATRDGVRPTGTRSPRTGSAKGSFLPIVGGTRAPQSVGQILAGVLAGGHPMAAFMPKALRKARSA
jgi:hypothetical protein